MPSNTLSITDNRTGKSYELPVEHDTVRALDLRQIKVNDEDFGMMTYDPGYTNTASCKSEITYIDGDKGILEYRGYPIEDLAENCSFLEVAYLILYGELPNQSQLDSWVKEVSEQTFLQDKTKNLVSSFPGEAHPMAVFISTTAGMSAFFADAKNVSDQSVRHLQIVRVLAKAPLIAAFAYRHTCGKPFIDPDRGLTYAGNFLKMLFAEDQSYKPNPILKRAVDILFILHADHEQNCSTSTMRMVGSSQADPFCSVAAAASALYGPLHGGANEAVLRMLHEIGSKDRIPEFIERVKGGEGRLMGFGHRVYKNYDPRARIIKKTAEDVFEVVGKNPLIDIAVELERIALEDEYFVKRKLYPNVDFYSGIIYEALGFPPEFFTVLFAIPRSIGWLSQWEEMINDKDQKIARPRQIFLGHRERKFVSMDKRS